MEGQISQRATRRVRFTVRGGKRGEEGKGKFSTPQPQRIGEWQKDKMDDDDAAAGLH